MMQSYQEGGIECISGIDFYAAYAHYTPDLKWLVYFASTEPVFHTTCLELKEVDFENPKKN